MTDSIPDLRDDLAVLRALSARLGSQDGDEIRTCIQRLADIAGATTVTAIEDAALRARATAELEQLVAAIGRLAGLRGSSAAVLHAIDVAAVVDQLRTFGSQLSTPCPETRALIRQLLPGRSELDARRALSLPVRLLELAEQHDTARAHTAAQLDPLLDAVIASGSPLGAVLAEQRTEIARAFRRVDLAHMTSGLRALSAWLAAPARDGAALAAQLRDQLAEALGPPTMPEPVARTPSLSEFAQLVS